MKKILLVALMAVMVLPLAAQNKDVKQRPDWPERETYSKFADITIPRTYLYNKEGKLIYSSIGYSEEEFGKLLKAIEGAL